MYSIFSCLLKLYLPNLTLGDDSWNRWRLGHSFIFVTTFTSLCHSTLASLALLLAADCQLQLFSIFLSQQSFPCLNFFSFPPEIWAFNNWVHYSYAEVKGKHILSNGPGVSSKDTSGFKDVFHSPFYILFWMVEISGSLTSKSHLFLPFPGMYYSIHGEGKIILNVIMLSLLSVREVALILPLA